MTSEKMAIGSGHQFSLDAAFRRKNWPSKRLIDVFYSILDC
jgi:hypothetical protein